MTTDAPPLKPEQCHSILQVYHRQFCASVPTGLCHETLTKLDKSCISHSLKDVNAVFVFFVHFFKIRTAIGNEYSVLHPSGSSFALWISARIRKSRISLCRKRIIRRWAIVRFGSAWTAVTFSARSYGRCCFAVGSGSYPSRRYLSVW